MLIRICQNCGSENFHPGSDCVQCHAALPSLEAIESPSQPATGSRESEPVFQILKNCKDLEASGEIIGRIIKALEENTVKDTELNQRLLRAKNLNQNLRPLYLQASTILLERAKLFTELAEATKVAADLNLGCKTTIDKMTNPGGLA